MFTQQGFPASFTSNLKGEPHNENRPFAYRHPERLFPRWSDDHGFDCVAIHDACATRGLTFNGEEIPSGKVHGAFLAALGAVYARVCSSADFAAEVVEKVP